MWSRRDCWSRCAGHRCVDIPVRVQRYEMRREEEVMWRVMIPWSCSDVLRQCSRCSWWMWRQKRWKRRSEWKTRKRHGIGPGKNLGNRSEWRWSKGHFDEDNRIGCVYENRAIIYFRSHVIQSFCHIFDNRSINGILNPHKSIGIIRITRRIYTGVKDRILRFLRIIDKPRQKSSGARFQR